MKPKEYAEILNAINERKTVDINQLINLVSEYLTDNNIEKSSEIITLLTQHPQLITTTLSTVINHICHKYAINSIYYNNQIILYYVTN